MSTPLTQNEINKALDTLNLWKASNDKLSKDLKFGDFREAIAFINRLAFEAEELQHHPEIFNVYNNVSISLSTHDAGNKITQKDVDLANRIEKLLS